MKKDFVSQGILAVIMWSADCVYYRLKASIFVEVGILWITGRSG